MTRAVEIGAPAGGGFRLPSASMAERSRSRLDRLHSRLARVQAHAKTTLRYGMKCALRPILYRHAPIGLEPERLYLWLDTLVATREVPGAVIEIGCDNGGTAAFASKMLDKLGIDKQYCCVDTFGGFVEEQFDADVGLGTSPRLRSRFAANSKRLVERNLRSLDAAEVQLIQADVTTLDPQALPRAISAALIDVDLSVPVLEALRRVYPLLSPGGVVLVDDCEVGGVMGWQARLGYEQFIAEENLPAEFRYGMGYVRVEVGNPERPGPGGGATPHADLEGERGGR